MLLSVSKQSFKTIAGIAAIHAVVGPVSRVYIAELVVAHGHAPALLAAVYGKFTEVFWSELAAGYIRMLC